MEPLEPLDIEFTVDCSPVHAFATWTAKVAQWWPHSHTVSGDRDVTVTIEPWVGGRIYERTDDGIEHDWGEILVWEPPRRLVYLWHLMFDRRDATEVEVAFAPVDHGDGADRTLVHIQHRGWERLGAAGPERRARNRQGWLGVVGHFQAACGPR